jgi:hypothetical protein
MDSLSIILTFIVIFGSIMLIVNPLIEKYGINALSVLSMIVFIVGATGSIVTSDFSSYFFWLAYYIVMLVIIHVVKKFQAKHQTMKSHFVKINDAIDEYKSFNIGKGELYEVIFKELEGFFTCAKDKKGLECLERLKKEDLSKLTLHNDLYNSEQLKRWLDK